MPVYLCGALTAMPALRQTIACLTEAGAHSPQDRFSVQCTNGLKRVRVPATESLGPSLGKERLWPYFCYRHGKTTGVWAGPLAQLPGGPERASISLKETA